VKTAKSGVTGFFIIWIGQVISVLATSMSSFALSLWIIQQSDSATVYGLSRVAYVTPILLLSPIAGVIIDRYSRKWIMILSDLIAALATVIILAFALRGDLQVWHIMIATIFQGIGTAFQGPAYSAAISTMIPKKHYGKINGLMSLMRSGTAVLAPICAGALYPVMGINGLLLIDLTTFVIAVIALGLVTIPSPVKSTENTPSKGSLWEESFFGVKYLLQHRSLFYMEMMFFFGNLFGGMASTLFSPMILKITEDNSLTLGFVLSASTIASVVGALIMSAWGGPKRRVHGVLLGTFISCLFGLTVVGLGKSPLVWIIGGVIFAGFNPIVNGCEMTILQTKVPPDVQGRVFSAVNFVSWFTNPIAPIIAGLLADDVMEPLMLSGSNLASTLGTVFGNQPGSGMGLIISLCGIGAALAGLAGYLFPSLRNVERDLPDHNVEPELQKVIT
jgi:MFS family permease